MVVLGCVGHMVKEHTDVGVMLECSVVSDVAGVVVETQGGCVV